MKSSRNANRFVIGEGASYRARRGIGRRVVLPCRSEAHRRSRLLAAFCVLTGLWAATWPTIAAADLIYQPVNPSFGGNPFNSAHLLGLADRQNQHKESGGSSARSSFRNSPADQFVRQLQSRMMSSLAQQVNEAVFGENAAESGRIVFGDQVITFERGLEAVHMVIEDSAAGTRTEVSVPILQVE